MLGTVFPSSLSLNVMSVNRGRWFAQGPLALLLALAPLLLVHGSGDGTAADDAECFWKQEGCEKDSRSASLLQLSAPLLRASQGMDSSVLDEEALLGREHMAPAPLGSEGLLGALLQSSEGAGQDPQLLQQIAADNVGTAFAAAKTGAAETVKAMQELQQSSLEAKSAHDLEAQTSAEVGNAIVGAMQRVEKASEVETRELGMEAEATRRLKEAAKSARQVQMLEDESAARETRAAGLLQNAIRKLEDGSANKGEDAFNPKQMAETLLEVEQAQKLVAEEENIKARESESLQQSLQGAATVVGALKASKEAQTTKWLQDALRELQWMHASWSQRTEAEAKVGKGLDGAVTSSESAEKAVVALVQDVVRKIRSTENMASQESAAALKFAEARQASRDRERQAVEAAHVSQLSSNLEALMQSIKASSDAQQMHMAQAIQQVSQSMIQPNLSPQQLPGLSGLGYMPFQSSPQAPTQMGPTLLQSSLQVPMQMGPQMPQQKTYWGY